MAGSDDSARRMPSLPWTVSIQAAAYAFAHRLDGSIRRSLFWLGDLKNGATPTPRPDAPDVRSADVTIDASRGLWARVFAPSAPAPAAHDAPLPVVVYFHGGGFVALSAASRPYDALCREICRALGAVVVSVDYRLAPRHRFPAAYDDGVAALRYLGASSALPGVPAAIDLSSCFLAGDSAGGNIAHHVAQRWAAAPTPPTSSPTVSLRVAGVILVQPFFGGRSGRGRRWRSTRRAALCRWPRRITIGGSSCRRAPPGTTLRRTCAARTPRWRGRSRRRWW